MTKDSNDNINFIPGLVNSVKSLLGFGKSDRDKDIKSDSDKKDRKMMPNSLDLNKLSTTDKVLPSNIEMEPDFQIEKKSSTNKNIVKPQTKIIKTEQAGKDIIPLELLNRFDLYPENRRRPVNKTVFNNEYLQLTFNTKNNDLAISSRGDLVFSAIPYDTARNYIQRAAIQSILHPTNTRTYIKRHRRNLETYLAVSIYQVSGKRVSENSPEVARAYQQIFEDPLFEMQILGRLMQHDETGPLSANLAGKFLYSENLKTGISAYLSEYIKFVIEATHTLQIATDGKHVQLLDSDYRQMNEEPQEQNGLVLKKESEISTGVARLPEFLKQDIKATLALSPISSPTQPVLRSKVGSELANDRKNYVAHSRHPKTLEKYFENVLATENHNQVNVVSDLHTIAGKLPFKNINFNILVGDVSDAPIFDSEIEGIYVMGNHELSTTLANSEITIKSKWDNYKRNQWFIDLIENPDASWSKLPVGNHEFYELIKEELASDFPKMKILNNEASTHNGIRYIGLTIPVALVKRKVKLQNYIFRSLNNLLADDTKMPTVIVSHAPLFNELSMLSPKNRSYNKDYYCSDERIEQLFSEYNIIGAIHGHHHIPASSGRYKKVVYANKELFVVCSIYSNINTGFDLEKLLPTENAGKQERR